MPMPFLTQLADTPWAMTASAVSHVLTLVDEQASSIEALMTQPGEPLANTTEVIVRDGVAIIPVVGPLFRYEGFLTFITGFPSYERLAQDFATALASPDISTIVFEIDSPGGEVNGCAELAQLIFNARGQKPIIAYASGDAASGAYWLASACDEIVVSDTSALGSIGVVGIFRPTGNNRATEIVSSQSPYKRLNPESDEGRTRLQTRIDALADVFIQAVARYRGVDPPDVIENFGSGDLYIGEQAVAQGLADSRGSLEALIETNTSLSQQRPVILRGVAVSESTENPDSLERQTTMSKHTENPTGSANDDKSQSGSENKTTSSATADQPGTVTEQPSPATAPGIGGQAPAATAPLSEDDLKVSHADLYQSIVDAAYESGLQAGINSSQPAATQQGEANGRQQERQRIGEILSAEEASGREQLAQHLAFATDVSVDMAVNMLKAAPAQQKATPQNEKKEQASPASSTGFEQVMASIVNPEIEPDGDEPEEETGVDAVAQRIAGISRQATMKGAA